MTRLISACVLLAALSTPARAQTADQWFSDIVRLWEAQRYADAFNEAVRYREERAYGKNEAVDYIIATSACRTGKAPLGRALYSSMLYHYSLDPASRTLVTNELNRCPPAAGLRPTRLAANSTAAQTGTRGKLYYLAGGGASGQKEMPLANQPLRVLREIAPEVFARRLFPAAQRDSAVAAVRTLLRPLGTYQVRSYGAFVVASAKHDSTGMRIIADGLTKYLRFYQRAFAMPEPEHLITVYLTQDVAELRRIADRVHGIRVSDHSIGYSFRNDFSMVGLNPDRTHGTLSHELFHLVVRRDFGDLPPWMDEGYAALYEVSRLRPNGDVEGLVNWRGRVLGALWYQRPSLDTLLRADWRAFEAEGEAADKQAVNHATARYFALFLQERGQLANVYRALRQRTLDSVSQSPGDDVVRRVEAALGEPLAKLDAAFSTWFRSLPPQR